MSTPGQGDGGYRPGPPNGGGSGSYGGLGEPTKYPGGQQSPYGQPSSPYAYSPYGAPYKPAPEEDKPPARPGILWLALTLLLISSAPFLTLGVLVLTQPLDAANLSAQTSAETMAQLQQYNLTVDQLVSAVKNAGLFSGVIALLYVIIAAVAVFTGRNVARIVVALLTTGFALLLAALLVLLGTTDLRASAVFGVILLAAVVGTVIMFLPVTRAYFTGRSR